MEKTSKIKIGDDSMDKVTIFENCTFNADTTTIIVMLVVIGIILGISKLK